MKVPIFSFQRRKIENMVKTELTFKNANNTFSVIIPRFPMKIRLKM